MPAGVTAPAAVTCREGESVTLPAADAPEGCTFLGWVTEDHVNVSVLPAVLTGAYAPTADVTLKALYARTVNTEAGFRLLTEAPEDWTGDYVITFGSGADATVLKGLSGTKKYESRTAGGSAALADSGMTLSGDLLTGVDGVFVFRFAESGGKYTIRNASAGTYLASKGGYLYSCRTDAASYCRWTPAMNGGAVDATNAASRTLTHLGFNAGKGWFTVARKAESQLCFWKLTDGGSVTVYTTVID